MPNLIKVLILEDDPKWLKSIINSLPNYEFYIAGCASDIDDALLLIDNVDFDIALIDINIGNHLIGLNLGNLITYKYNKPYIFISESIESKIYEAVLQSNATNYILKPFTIYALQINIRNAYLQHIKTTFTTVNTPLEITQPTFFVEDNKKIKKILWNEVVSLRTNQNKTTIISFSNKEFEFRCSLQNMLSYFIPNTMNSIFSQKKNNDELTYGNVKEFVNTLKYHY